MRSLFGESFSWVSLESNSTMRSAVTERRTIKNLTWWVQGIPDVEQSAVLDQTKYKSSARWHFERSHWTYMTRLLQGVHAFACSNIEHSNSLVSKLPDFRICAWGKKCLHAPWHELHVRDGWISCQEWANLSTLESDVPHFNRDISASRYENVRVDTANIQASDLVHVSLKHRQWLMGLQ